LFTVHLYCLPLLIAHFSFVFLICYCSQLAFLAFSCYIYSMTVTQTVDIPASHRLTIDVPREIPTGKAVLAFTPATTDDDDGLDYEGDCPLCAKSLTPNAETIAAIQEGRAMLRGEIPATWHTSLDDLDEMLGL
jgi:hypothetical protein